MQKKPSPPPDSVDMIVRYKRNKYVVYFRSKADEKNIMFEAVNMPSSTARTNLIALLANSEHKIGFPPKHRL
jgi:hypothetical protein